MFNRWIHICQAMDFNNYQITTAVNGYVSDKTNFTQDFKLSNPLRRNETLKDRFAIGAAVDWFYYGGGHWFGK